MHNSARTFSHVIRIACAVLATAWIIAASAKPLAAEDLTEAMVKSRVEAWIAAFDSNDADFLASVDAPADGFGFRRLEPRSAATPRAAWIDGLRSFFASMEYYRIQLNELHTSVDGDIGLAWGFFTEDFQQKGQDPEKVRVRFSMSLKYNQGKWRTLLYHRDIQNFGQNGRYIRHSRQ